MPLPKRPLSSREEPLRPTVPNTVGALEDGELDILGGSTFISAEVADAGSEFDDLELDIPVFTRPSPPVEENPEVAPVMHVSPSILDNNDEWNIGDINLAADIMQKREELETKQEIVVEDFETGELVKYIGIGELTADEVLYTPYSAFEHLEERVESMTAYIQGILSEKGRSQDIADARRKRGALYVEMATEIDRLVLRKLSSDEPIAAEDTKRFVAMIVNEILGFGPIEPLWQNKEITEIMINGPRSIRVEIKGKKIIAKGIQFRNADHLLQVCRQMLSLIGRRIDSQHPKEDGSLPDGSRINVVHQELAPHGPIATIRRFPDTAYSVKTLVKMGSFTEDMAVEIGNLIHNGCSCIVAGGTGTGKTSMLNALSGCIPEDDRIITIEDTLELRLNPNKHVVALVSRPESASGTGAVSIRDLVRNALRMAPQRIVVGEVRDGSAYDMLNAMNTGHEGSLTTVHANDALGTVERVALLVSEAGEISPDRALSLIAGGVDVFIMVDRYEDGSRRVAGIYEIPSNLELVNGKLSVRPIPLWEFVHDSTDVDGNISGHYEKMNELSESLIRKHRLNVKKRLTLEELYNISEV